MDEVSTIGLDIAKNVFQAHGADANAQMMVSKRITRRKLLDIKDRRANPAAIACHRW